MQPNRATTPPGTPRQIPIAGSEGAAAASNSSPNLGRVVPPARQPIPPRGPPLRQQPARKVSSQVRPVTNPPPPQPQSAHKPSTPATTGTLTPPPPPPPAHLQPGGSAKSTPTPVAALTEDEEQLINYFDQYAVFEKLNDLVTLMLREKPQDPEIFLLSQLRAWDASERALGQAYAPGPQYHLRPPQDGNNNNNSNNSLSAGSPTRSRSQQPPPPSSSVTSKDPASQSQTATTVSGGPKESFFSFQHQMMHELEQQRKEEEMLAAREEAKKLEEARREAAIEMQKVEEARAAELAKEREKVKAVKNMNIRDYGDRPQSAALRAFADMWAIQVLQYLCSSGLSSGSATSATVPARTANSTTLDIHQYYTKTPLRHLYRIAYESPLHYYDTVPMPTNFGESTDMPTLVPMEVPRLCYLVAYRVVQSSGVCEGGDQDLLAMTAGSEAVSELSRVSGKLSTSLSLSLPNTIGAADTTNSESGVISVLQFRLMLRLCHAWLCALTSPMKDWCNLLRRAMLTMIGYEGIPISPALVQSVAAQLKEAVIHEIHVSIQTDEVSALALCTQVFEASLELLVSETQSILNDVRMRDPAVKALLSSSKRDKAVSKSTLAQHLISGRADASAPSKEIITTTLQAFSGITEEQLRGALLSSRGSLLQSSSLREQVNVLRSLLDVTCVDAADTLLTHGFMSHSDLAALFAHALRCVRPDKFKGCALYQPDVRHLNDGCVEELRLRSWMVTRFVQLIAVFQQDGADCVVEDRIMEPDFRCPQLVSLLRKSMQPAVRDTNANGGGGAGSLDSPSESMTVLNVLSSRLPHCSLNDCKCAIETAMALAEGAISIPQAIVDLSRSGILASHITEFCQCVCIWIRKTEQRSRVLLFARWCLQWSRYVLTHLGTVATCVKGALMDVASAGAGGAADGQQQQQQQQQQSRGVLLNLLRSDAVNNKESGVFIDAVKNPITRMNLQNMDAFNLQTWHYLTLIQEVVNADYWRCETLYRLDLLASNGIGHSEGTRMSVIPLERATAVADRMQWRTARRQSGELTEMPSLWQAEGPNGGNCAILLAMACSVNTLASIIHQMSTTECPPFVGCELKKQWDVFSTDDQQDILLKALPVASLWSNSMTFEESSQNLHKPLHNFFTNTSGITSDGLADIVTRLLRCGVLPCHLPSYFSRVQQGVVSRLYNINNANANNNNNSSKASTPAKGNTTTPSKLAKSKNNTTNNGIAGAAVSTSLSLGEVHALASSSSPTMTLSSTPGSLPYFTFMARRTLLYALTNVDRKVSQYVARSDRILQAWEEFLKDPGSVFECTRALLETIPPAYLHAPDFSEVREKLRVRPQRFLFHPFSTRALPKDRMELGAWIGLHPGVPQGFIEDFAITMLDVFAFQHNQTHQKNSYELVKLIQHVDSIFRSLLSHTQPRMADVDAMRVVLSQQCNAASQQVADSSVSSSTGDYNAARLMKSTASLPSAMSASTGATATVIAHDEVGSPNSANAESHHFVLLPELIVGAPSSGTFATFCQSRIFLELVGRIEASSRFARDWFVNTASRFLACMSRVLNAIREENHSLVLCLRDLLTYFLLEGNSLSAISHLLGLFFDSLDTMGVVVDRQLPDLMHTILDLLMESTLVDNDCSQIILTTLYTGGDHNSGEVLPQLDRHASGLQQYCQYRRGVRLPMRLIFMYYRVDEHVKAGDKPLLGKEYDGNGNSNNNNQQQQQQQARDQQHHDEFFESHSQQEDPTSEACSKAFEAVMYLFLKVANTHLDSFNSPTASTSTRKTARNASAIVNNLVRKDAQARAGAQVLFLLASGPSVVGMSMLSAFGQYVRDALLPDSSLARATESDVMALFVWSRVMAEVSNGVHALLSGMFMPNMNVMTLPIMLRNLPIDASNLETVFCYKALQESEDLLYPAGVVNRLYYAGTSAEYFAKLCDVLYAYMLNDSDGEEQLCRRLSYILEGSPFDILLACMIILGGVQDHSLVEGHWNSAFGASMSASPTSVTESANFFGQSSVSIGLMDGRESMTGPMSRVSGMRTKFRGSAGLTQVVVNIAHKIIMRYDTWMNECLGDVVSNHNVVAGDVLAQLAATNIGEAQFEEHVPLAANIVMPKQLHAASTVFVESMTTAVRNINSVMESIRTSMSSFAPSSGVVEGRGITRATMQAEKVEPRRLYYFSLCESLLITETMIEWVHTMGLLPRDMAFLSLLPRETNPNGTTLLESDSNSGGSPTAPTQESLVSSPTAPPPVLTIGISDGFEEGRNAIDALTRLWQHTLCRLNDKLRVNIHVSNLQVPAEDREALSVQFAQIESLVDVSLRRALEANGKANEYNTMIADYVAPHPFVERRQIPAVLQGCLAVTQQLWHGQLSNTVIASSNDIGGQMDNSLSGGRGAFLGNSMSSFSAPALPQALYNHIFFDGLHPHCFSFIHSLLRTMKVSGGKRGVKLAKRLALHIYVMLLQQRVQTLEQVVCLSPSEGSELATAWENHVPSPYEVVNTQPADTLNLYKYISLFITDVREETLRHMIDLLDTFMRGHARDILCQTKFTSVLLAYVYQVTIEDQRLLHYLLEERWTAAVEAVCLTLHLNGAMENVLLLAVRALRSLRIIGSFVETLRNGPSLFAHLHNLPFRAMQKSLSAPGLLRDVDRMCGPMSSNVKIVLSMMEQVLGDMHHVISTGNEIAIKEQQQHQSPLGNWTTSPLANSNRADRSHVGQIVFLFAEWVETTSVRPQAPAPIQDVASVINTSIDGAPISDKTVIEAGADEHIQLMLTLTMMLAQEMLDLFNSASIPPLSQMPADAVSDVYVSVYSRSYLSEGDETRSAPFALPATAEESCVVGVLEDLRLITLEEASAAVGPAGGGGPGGRRPNNGSPSGTPRRVSVAKSSGVPDRANPTTMAMRRLVQALLAFLMDATRRPESLMFVYNAHEPTLLTLSTDLGLDFDGFCRVCHSLHAAIQHRCRSLLSPETSVAVGRLLLTLCRTMYPALHVESGSAAAADGTAAAAAASTDAAGGRGGSADLHSLGSRRLVGAGSSVPMIPTKAALDGPPSHKVYLDWPEDTAEGGGVNPHSPNGGPPGTAVMAATSTPAAEDGKVQDAETQLARWQQRNVFIQRSHVGRFPYAELKIVSAIWITILAEWHALYLASVPYFTRNYYERTGRTTQQEHLRAWFVLFHRMCYGVCVSSWLSPDMLRSMATEWITEEHGFTGVSDAMEAHDIVVSVVHAVTTVLASRAPKYSSAHRPNRKGGNSASSAATALATQAEAQFTFYAEPKLRRAWDAALRYTVTLIDDGYKETETDGMEKALLSVQRKTAQTVSGDTSFQARRAWRALVESRSDDGTGSRGMAVTSQVSSGNNNNNNMSNEWGSPLMGAPLSEGGDSNQNNGMMMLPAEQRDTAPGEVDYNNELDNYNSNARSRPVSGDENAPTGADGYKSSNPTTGASSPLFGNNNNNSSANYSNNNNNNSNGSALVPPSYTRPRWDQNREGLFTMEQVAAAHTPDQTWTVINGVVYDITRFVHDHPGGMDVLVEHCGGQDGTEKFFAQHGGDMRVLSQLERMRIGTVDVYNGPNH